MVGSQVVGENVKAMAAAARDEAAVTLVHLEADRIASEQRAAANGRRDPIQWLTGESSLERAVATTKTMLADLETLLEELEQEVGVNGHGVGNGRMNGNGVATVNGVC